jgi:hypothetical protein
VSKEFAEVKSHHQEHTEIPHHLFQNFTPTMPCKTKKELFMSNSHNKQAFINMPCEKLNEHDIRYKNAVYDAGLLVVHTAVECALSPEVIVIGEDTDLLVLVKFMFGETIPFVRRKCVTSLID